MVRAGVNDPTQWQREVESAKKTLAGTPQGMTMSPPMSNLGAGNRRAARTGPAAACRAAARAGRFGHRIGAGSDSGRDATAATRRTAPSSCRPAQAAPAPPPLTAAPPPLEQRIPGKTTVTTQKGNFMWQSDGGTRFRHSNSRALRRRHLRGTSLWWRGPRRPRACVRFERR